MGPMRLTSGHLNSRRNVDRSLSIKSTRILLLFPHMVLPGGALNYTLQLAAELVKKGAQVALLVLKEKKGNFDVPSGVQVISLNGPLTSSLRYWIFSSYWQSRLNRAISAWKPDVLVPQVFPANWWGWLYKCRYPSVRLVWICHEPSAFIHSAAWIRALRPWWKSMLARALQVPFAYLDIFLSRHSDSIIANSGFTASEIKRVYKIEPNAITYPGVDFESLSGKKLHKKREIITVARLTKFKKIDFLIDVFNGVLKTYPDLIYNIVGTGEDESSLRSRVSSLGLESRVIFHGVAEGPALKSLYERASLFLHGSIGEPFGMAPLEAIACGTPVVAHRSGGLMEIVNEDCGRLVESLDPDDWAREIVEYLEYLFSHQDFPVRVRECARKFDWRNSLAPAIEIIAEI